MKFADDTKIFCTVDTMGDTERLQGDLDSLLLWSRDWCAHWSSTVLLLGIRNQVMRKFCAEEFRLLMECRHHQRGLFATMVVQLLTW